jgi:uncharacterized repeat protein (TIGR03837 family)
MHWDIFCKVVDNHGDAGVCWRLASELARRGDTVRLWIDDPSPLRWMAPNGEPGVQVIPWSEFPPTVEPGDAVVEAFGCDPPPEFVARMKRPVRTHAWINLEYLSAEPYVERSHGLPSPVSQGPGAGLVKQFFYPGFTPRTGGLLREEDLQSRRAAFDRHAWLRQWGVAADGARVVSLFCYEPGALAQLLRQLAEGPVRTELLVTPGRAAQAVRAAGVTASTELLELHWLPLLSQRDYDHLLWSCDLNFVRGEDSVVRGVLAGVPFVWQAYPQADGAHGPKLQAFLQWLQAPPSLADFYRCWNGLDAGPLPALDVAGWRPCAAEAATRAMALPELAAGLRRLAAERGRI